MDETYVNVKGKWCYLYRAIDRDGNLVDSMFSEKRDMEAAKRFFKQAVDVVGHAPERVTTDGHDSYPRAIRETLGHDVLHRTNRYLNNRLEQDHRGIKQRYYPMRGFGSVASASRFCRAFDGVRQFFRVRTTDEATGFPCPATRGVPPPIGRFEGHDAGGLTSRRWQARSAQHIFLIPVFSVLTHPVWLGWLGIGVPSPCRDCSLFR